MTTTERELERDPDGVLHVPADVLEGFAATHFRVRVEAGKVTLEPRPKRFSEIEDPEERKRAIEAWLSGFGRPTGVSWPEDYNPRDDIYD